MHEAPRKVYEKFLSMKNIISKNQFPLKSVKPPVPNLYNVRSEIIIFKRFSSRKYIAFPRVI